jgi:divalent metal cation (Fe/Co/Zn/Cd) transporter
MNLIEEKLYTQAYNLALFTICYNIIEGIISVVLGYEDKNLTLIGFGLDSFIEVMSNLGIVYMITRIRQSPQSERSEFEKTALKVTGYAFYFLCIGLLTGIIFTIVEEQRPNQTFAGIVVSLLSIMVMIYVYTTQIRIGKQLNSAPIIADGECTKVCVYMSIVLLISSGIYQFTGFKYADVIGLLGLIYFSYTEGRECFEKAKGNECRCEVKNLKN